MTPAEAAQSANTFLYAPEKNTGVMAFLRAAPATDLQEFICLLTTDAYSKFTTLANTALSIRLAADAEQTAQKLVTGTENLIAETAKLVQLTKRLCGLTIVLAVLASFEIFKFLFGVFCHHIQ